MIRSIIRYIILLVFIIVCAFVYESYELTYLFSFLCILPVVNILVVNYSYKRIKVELSTKVSVINKGNYIPINLEIDNKGILPVMWIEVYFRFKNNYHITNKEISFVVPILKYGKQEYTFRIKSEYCGDMDIEMLHIKYMDYFKLFYREKKIQKNIRVYVLPQVGNIENIEIERKCIIDIDGEKFSETKSGDDPSQVFDIREYIPGDKMHGIHWKLSARKSRLMVKEFSLPLNGYYSVIMDLACKEESKIKDYIDVITEVVLAVVMRLQQEGINHYLVGCERERDVCFKDIISSDLSLTETMFELFKSQYCPQINILDCIDKDGLNSNDSQIYFITSNLNKNNIIKFAELYSNAHKKIISICTNKHLDKELVNYAIANEVEIEVIDLENSLDSIEELIL